MAVHLFLFFENRLALIDQPQLLACDFFNIGIRRGITAVFLDILRPLFFSADLLLLICHLYLVFVILLSWVPFAIGDWNQMLTFLSRLFGIGAAPANPADYLTWGKGCFGLMAMGVLLATPFPGKLWSKIRHTLAADVLLVVLFWIVIYFISTAAQDPFLYFAF